MIPRAPRIAATVAFVALVMALVPAVAPGARAVDPPIAAESPSPGASAVPTPIPDPTPTPAPTPAPTPTPSPAIGSPDSPMSKHLSGDVYGYLPYWEVSSAALEYIDWNALSVLSLFSVTQTASGTLDPNPTGYRTINGPLGRALMTAAHARGVRVEITFTSFGLSKNRNFFSNATRQATTISELRTLVRNLGADGVNVDVESLENVYFQTYGKWVGQLRTALRADNPKATVSVATNANLSGAWMARRAVQFGADRVFVMGYAYRSAGSSPGAIAPLDDRGSPGGLDLRWTLDTYAAAGVPLGKVILGLPYYGMSWPTASASLGAARTGSGSTYTPRANLGKPASLNVPLRYEPTEEVSWYAYYDAAAKTWRQVFYDTPRSLRPKYQLAVDRGLAGVGMWALGYDRGVAGYWDLLKTMFGPPRVTSVKGIPAATRTRRFDVAVASAPGSRPLSTIRLSLNGTSWGSWQPVPVPVADAGGVPSTPLLAISPGPTAKDGAYRVYAQVRDEGGTLSKADYGVVKLDRAGPVMRTPSLWYSTTARTWRARWSATDLTGVAGYRVWVSVNGKPWRVVTLRTTATGLRLPVTSRSARVTVIVRAVDVLGTWGASRSRHN